MPDAGENAGRLSVASVALDAATAGRVAAVASEAGAARSRAAGELAAGGAAVLLAEAADGDGPFRDARASMPDGSSPRITARLVETRALPEVFRGLGADLRWLSALPQAQRRDMSARIARAAASLAGDGGAVPWALVLSAVRVMCRWSSPPWVVSGETRAEACRRADGRIASLLPAARSGGARAGEAAGPAGADGGPGPGPGPAAELAWLSAWRLAAEASDAPGAPPEGPLALAAAMLAPRPRGRVDEGAEAMRREAGGRLAALLGARADEARAVGEAARSALEALRLGDAAALRAAALALAGYAQRLAAPLADGAAVGAAGGGQDRASLALSQRGAREIAGYAAAHPRAKLAALEAAGHVSHSTLQRRLVQLEAAGVMRNAGTQARPLWQVAGVERDPEDELTERQAQVLALMRREPPARTPEIARAIGASSATVFAAYRELAALGLAEKSANRWVAVPRGEAPAGGGDAGDGGAGSEGAPAS